MIATPPIVYARGWSGYGWDSSTKAAAEFIVPNLRSPGSIAIWTGLGDGDPGLQQIGVTVTAVDGLVIGQAWFEMWPAQAEHIGSVVRPGDLIFVKVTRAGDDYTLTIFDDTRHWEAVTHQYSADIEPGAEAVAEDFGPQLPDFEAFPMWTSAEYFTQRWEMAGAYSWRTSGNSMGITP